MPNKLLFSGNQLKSVVVYTAPPGLGGQAMRLSPAKVARRFSLDEFSNQVYLDESLDESRVAALPFNKKLGVDYDDLIQQVTQYAKDPVDNLCLAFINQKVGYAVFATQLIPINSVVGIYSGIVVNTQSSRIPNNFYLMQMTGHYAVDGSKIRSLGGFMAHLLVDHDKDLEVKLKKCRDRRFLAAYLCRSLEEIEHAFAVGVFTDEVVTDILTRGAAEGRNTDKELNNILFSNPNVRHCLASANVTQQLIPYNGTYIVALVTTRDILPSQIVGLTYTEKYWQNCGTVPELFSVYGDIILHQFYKRSLNLQVSVKAIDGQSYRLTADRHYFLELVHQDIPALIDNKQIVSVYDLRNKLVMLNALAESYAALPQNSAALYLERCLARAPISVLISVFWCKPDKVAQQSSNIHDHAVALVIRAKDDASYQQIGRFFSPVECFIVKFPVTKEMVLPDVNSDADKAASIRSFLLR